MTILETREKGFAEARAILGQIGGLFSTRALTAVMERIAMSAEVIIKSRTLSGNDVRGLPFQPYSTGYARYKANRKKKGSRSYTGVVNLFDTGKLFNSIKHEMKTPTSVLIYVGGNPSVYGLAHQTGAGNVPTREWFGLSGSEKNLLGQQFAEEADEIWSTISGGKK